MVGIDYDKETKEHTCVIEQYQKGVSKNKSDHQGRAL